MRVNYNDLVNIYEKEIRVNTKNKKKIYNFERFKIEYLNEIYYALNNNLYKDMKYNIFMIKDPKYRIVMSLNIKDKIINHYVTRFILMPKLEKYLDMRNVATRKNKGRDYGINLVKKYLEHFKTKDSCYVLKIDMSKYFYSIDHSVLKEMIKKDLYSYEYEIISSIIDSTNYSYINDKIISLKEKEIKYNSIRKKEIEEIPLYKFGKGLPIGNMSSQFLSIFYLNRIDHKIVHDYHLKYMVRYMDDIVIFHEDKEYLKKIKMLLEEELLNTYKLKINKKKTNIMSIKEGVVFCGYRFRIIDKKTVINVCKSTRERVKKRVKEVKYLYINNKISLDKAFFSINTYYNGFKYGSRLNIKRIVDKYFFG